VAGVARRHRDIARGRSLIACECCDVAGVSGRVALLGGVHAVRGRLVALTSAALTDLPGALMLLRFDAVREVTIAGGLVAICRYLIAVGAGLVAVRTGLIGVCERLVGIGQRLLAIGQRLLVTQLASDALLLLSLDLPVGRCNGTIA